MRRSIRANLVWAFGYNAAALSLAAAGLLQPVLAAALMAGSSLVIVARTLHGRSGAEMAAEAPGSSWADGTARSSRTSGAAV
ncbi:putative Copper-exporting P-type ATPase (fragment) [Thiocapsa sp. KS1]